jgi:DNA polymerase III subunit gamma/tau
MNDHNWDLKYRPRTFSDVLGNHGVISLILKRSQTGTLGDQSMMLAGPKGCGKTSIARLIARALRCSSLKNGEPCGECPSCFAIINETSDSVQELDAASQGSVDRVREMVRDIDYNTFDGKSQVYIIDESQRLTAQAQDAFLKSVEDRLFTVILCTTEPHKMKGPLRSRVEEYPISPPKLEEIIPRLSNISVLEGVKADPEALRVIVNMNDCCPRTSILSLQRMSVLGDVTIDSVRQFFRFNSYELIDKILYNLDSSPVSAFAMLDELASIEGPVWIRDTIVFAIVSGMRVDIGVKSNYPVSTRFFQNRLQGWLTIAKELGGIERPTLFDIEAVLLMDQNRIDAPKIAPVFSNPSTLVPSVPIPVPPVAVIPLTVPVSPVVFKSEPVSKSVLDAVRSKSLELDGVKYTSDERLTTLDDKVNTPKSDIVISEKDVPPVELDQAHAPISEKELIRNLISRVKKG